jgi:hypothetical protein
MIGDLRIPRLTDFEPAVGWTLIGFGSYVAAGLAAPLVVASVCAFPLRLVGLDPEPGTFGWGLYLASSDLVWGGLAAVAAAGLGRRLIPRLAVASPPAAAILAVGIVLAAVTTLALHEWVRARYEWFDPEYAGLAFFAGPAVIAAALAGWGTLVLPGHVRRRPVQWALVAAGFAFVAAVSSTVPGLADGVSPSGWPLALSLGLDALFVLVLVVTSLVARSDD